MNPLNYFPKVINVKDYLSKFNEGYKVCENVNAYLSLVTTRDNKQFRLSYTMYNQCEGGAEAYLPFKEEDVDFFDKSGYFYGSFDGGFVGDDIDELIEHMGRWLVENDFM